MDHAVTVSIVQFEMVGTHAVEQTGGEQIHPRAEPEDGRGSTSRAKSVQDGPVRGAQIMRSRHGHAEEIQEAFPRLDDSRIVQC